MGIGICSGDVVVGTIGSKLRAKYAVVGNPVNLASRIQALTTGGQILAPEATVKGVDRPLTFDGELVFEPKGYHETLKLYSINGIGGDHSLTLPVKSEIVVASKQKDSETKPRRRRPASKPKPAVETSTAGEAGTTTKARRTTKNRTSSKS
jgi:hypothetical protein